MGRNKTKGKNISLEKVGVCIKSQDETVEYQNELCEKLCGNQKDKKCEKGCMHRYSKGTVDQIFDRGFKVFKNVDTNGNIVDALMINDGDKITTLLYDKNEVIAKQLEYIKQFHLSKAEMKVMEKFLSGYSHHEIAEQLFISKPTLRTHLNNIYKKFPENLKKEILASHLGKEIKAKKAS